MDTRTFSNIPTFSRQRSYERLQLDANRLFDIGWLIERLTIELRFMFHDDKVPAYPQLMRNLRGNAEHWFAWEMLHAHAKSIGKIRDMQQLFPERDLLVEQLQEEREQQIKEFSKLMISKRWDMLRDDDTSWRKFALMMYKLKETPETAEQFFALTDYIFMLTIVIMGKENLYFPDTTEEEEAEEASKTTEYVSFESIDVKAELKLFFKGAWFDKFSTDKKRFTPEWRDVFINKLIASTYGNEILKDMKKKPLMVKGPILGCLKAAGVFSKDQSNLGIAKEILYPNWNMLPSDRESVKERNKKAKTLSSYIGLEKRQKFYFWVIDYVNGAPPEE